MHYWANRSIDQMTEQIYNISMNKPHGCSAEGMQDEQEFHLGEMEYSSLGCKDLTLP